jgi:hypothetical protein
VGVVWLGRWPRGVCLVGGVGEGVRCLVRLPGLPCLPQSPWLPRWACSLISIDGSSATGRCGLSAACDGRRRVGLLMAMGWITHMGSCNAWGRGWLAGLGWLVAA